MVILLEENLRGEEPISVVQIEVFYQLQIQNYVEWIIHTKYLVIFWKVLENPSDMLCNNVGNAGIVSNKPSMPKRLHRLNPS